jgi:hypothetical protein
MRWLAPAWAALPVGSSPRLAFNQERPLRRACRSTLLNRHNVLREFRKITQAAGLGAAGDAPHLVFLLSSDGMLLEDIADLIGYKGTTTTGTVYRRVIVPKLRRGAEVMDRLFS